jgi:hypothetical protein
LLGVARTQERSVGVHLLILQKLVRSGVDGMRSRGYTS